MNGIRRASAAEAYGTFLLTLVGPATITATRLADGFGSTAAALGFIGLAHGVALLVAVYSIGHISGAHINPAVTIASWATKRIEPRRVAPYIIAQLVGATIAGLVQLDTICHTVDIHRRANLRRATRRLLVRSGSVESTILLK